MAEALTLSQQLGMLGARPVDEVIEHAQAFVVALADVTGRVIDLGTGGGVPGLVIAAERPDLRLVLVDRRATRTDHVRRLVRRLGWEERVEVVTADARSLPRATADAVVARGFAAPTATLTAAAPLLRPDGLLVVSEPPAEADDRWPAAALQRAGLTARSSPDRRVAVFVRG